jgi:general secretion pathway protein K
LKIRVPGEQAGSEAQRAVSDEGGFALFLVLWVLTLLAVIVGEFCHAMRTELNITRNYVEEVKAYYIGLAGANMAIAELVRKEVFPVDEQAQAELKKEDNPLRINMDLPPMGFGEGSFVLRIGNESGKIDLNSTDEDTLKMVFGSLGLDEDQVAEIVDSILDWKDEDDLHRASGAENDYYKRLDRPYRCKNGDFDSVEELLLVRGISKDIYMMGLKEIFTVIPSQGAAAAGLVPRRMPFGPPGWAGRMRGMASSKGVNINAATRSMLKALPVMTDELAQGVEEFRKERDFKSPTEVAEVLGPEVYGSVSPHLNTLMSPFYTIRAAGMVAGGTVQQGVEVMVRIDRTIGKGFERVRWIDGISEPVSFTQPPEPEEEK